MGTHPIFESDFDCLTDSNRRLAHRCCDASTSRQVTTKMSAYKEGKEEAPGAGDQEHKIRITITSKNCSAIERISNELVKAAKDKNLKVRAPSACRPRPCVLPRVKRPMVRVPRPGIVTRCAFTSVSLISSHQPRPCDKSPNCQSIPVWMLRSPSATKHYCSKIKL